MRRRHIIFLVVIIITAVAVGIPTYRDAIKKPVPVPGYDAKAQDVRSIFPHPSVSAGYFRTAVKDGKLTYSYSFAISGLLDPKIPRYFYVIDFKDSHGKTYYGDAAWIDRHGSGWTYGYYIEVPRVRTGTVTKNSLALSTEHSGKVMRQDISSVHFTITAMPMTTKLVDTVIHSQELPMSSFGT